MQINEIIVTSNQRQTPNRKQTINERIKKNITSTTATTTKTLLRLTIETKPTHALHQRPHTKFKYFVTLFFMRCYLFWLRCKLAIYAAYSTDYRKDL